MLRINKDGTIPTGNPFYATATGNNRAIWALGLRNPFKFAVQPGTGTIFINDVGADAWEEINRDEKGANYGWNLCEGNHDNPNRPGSVNCSAAPYSAPVHEYAHGNTAYHGLLDHGRHLLQPGDCPVPEWVRGRLLLRGLLQRLDKDVRSHDRRGERVRNRVREAHRPGGEQGWRTVLPDAEAVRHQWARSATLPTRHRQE